MPTKPLKSTRTEQNILTAFIGECQARTRYEYFAKKAKKEGFVQIHYIFLETARQEQAHASRLFKLMQGGDVEVQASFPFGVNGTTEENLRAAAKGEMYEDQEMYPAFAKVAREEGFDSIAVIFETIGIAERMHGQRFLALADAIANGTTFSREESQTWHCIKCGYLHEGKEAPDVCPACAHSKSYFEIFKENW
ncbi:MAG: rubrerythrin family protein [Magnetococcales bacterium]|nr:rubrerythrin family protein [Magnetococcales bacterium]